MAATMDPEAGPELARIISNATVEDEKEPVLIDWEAGDPENPFNWSKARKWRSIGLAFAFSFFTAQNATTYVAGFPTMLKDLHTTEVVALLGNAALFIVAAIAPIILAPISEQFGRRKLLIFSNIGQTLLYIPQGAAHNIVMLIVFRAVQGLPASSGNSLVGGFVADVFRAEERGFPMSVFTFLVFSSTALGGIIFGWVDVGLRWRWCQWLTLIINGILTVLTFFFLEETRGSKILAGRADKLTKETGRLHLPRSAQSSGLPVRDQIKLAAGRAIRLLLTEPIVLVFSLYIACLWGEVFLFFNSVPYVFRQYNFSAGVTATVFVASVIGASFGSIFCHFTDKLYQRDRRRSATGRAPPESRLYPCLLGAVVTPAAYFLFAWTGQPHIHWIAPVFGLGIFNFGVFPIYMASFSYMADTYELYASSAVAAQSCLRNMLGGCLPLVAPTMYHNLRYPIAGTILASISAVFIPVPFVLFFFGARIRSWSKVATHIGQLETGVQEVHEKSDATVVTADAPKLLEV